MGKANVRKTKNGYLFDFYHKDIYGNLHRSRHLIRPSVMDRRKAEAIARRLLNEAQKLGYVPGYDPEPSTNLEGVLDCYPFDRFISMWFSDWIKTHAKKHSDVVWTESSLRSRLVPFFKDTPLDEIDAWMVDQFKTRCRQGPGPVLSPKSVNNHLSTLRRIFDDARRWGYLESVPVITSLDLDDAPDFRGWTTSERDQFLRTCWKLRRNWFAYFYLATHTGLRHGEICGLRWRDIDFDKQQFEVKVALYRGHEGTPKSKRKRPIPMTPELRTILQAIPRRGERVFYSTEGNELGPNAGTKVLKTVSRLAGVPVIRKHDLRHTFGNSIAPNEGGFMAANQVMGHEDPKMTMNYCHVKDEQVAAEMAKITTPFRELGVDLGELKKETLAGKRVK
ncbi:MAG: site-specific integrase [Deltaproteobacteria bacterium]|nr:site-specific integrase [Deltaproteobacteria bacterium]